jgi:short-subunit dehydrogenase involved in D-alanine esterification of teichoic acids
MSPLYKKALIIGATSGIGGALAAKLVASGTSVIVSGRRHERLNAFVSQHGSSKASAAAFDITELSSIPEFASRIVKEHPDLDCVVLNSGIQRPFDFSKPDTIDLATFDQELTTNYTSFVHLVTAFLPHLQRVGKEKEAHIVFISASLGLVPGMTRTPGYNASKAALHSWIITLRQQLKDAGNQIRVVEVFPPAVQTELHDEKHQPDMQNGGEIGMPLVQFLEAMYAELQKGDEQFAIGPAQEWLEKGFEAERQKLFQHQQAAIKASLAKYLK